MLIQGQLNSDQCKGQECCDNNDLCYIHSAHCWNASSTLTVLGTSCIVHYGCNKHLFLMPLLLFVLPLLIAVVVLPLWGGIVININDVNTKGKEWVQRARARDEGKTKGKRYWQRLIKKDDGKWKDKTMTTDADTRTIHCKRQMSWQQWVLLHS